MNTFHLILDEAELTLCTSNYLSNLFWGKWRYWIKTLFFFNCFISYFENKEFGGILEYFTLEMIKTIFNFHFEKYDHRKVKEKCLVSLFFAHVNLFSTYIFLMFFFLTTIVQSHLWLTILDQKPVWSKMYKKMRRDIFCSISIKSPKSWGIKFRFGLIFNRLLNTLHPGK